MSFASIKFSSFYRTSKILFIASPACRKPAASAWQREYFRLGKPVIVVLRLSGTVSIALVRSNSPHKETGSLGLWRTPEFRLIPHCMSREVDDLISILDAPHNKDSLLRVLDLLWFNKTGNLTAFRTRLKQLLTGAARKRRKNWLDFILRFLDAYESHYGDFELYDLDDLDVEELPNELWSADHKILLDLWLDRVREACACFERFPPVDMLPDLLAFVDEGDGSVSFTLPADFHWPTSIALQNFAGAIGEAVDDGDSGSSERIRMEEVERKIEEYRDELGGVSESVVRYLSDEISENRFGLSGDSSMATLRKTIGFDLDVTNFYIFNYDIRTPRIHL